MSTNEKKNKIKQGGAREFAFTELLGEKRGMVSRQL
jgi:hypothetical protein